MRSGPEPRETVRWPEEACSVCGRFGPFGLGPPARPLLASGEIERRCAAHVWPEWWAGANGLPVRTDGAPAAPPPRNLLQGRLL